GQVDGSRSLSDATLLVGYRYNMCHLRPGESRGERRISATSLRAQRHYKVQESEAGISLKPCLLEVISTLVPQECSTWNVGVILFRESSSIVLHTLQDCR